MKTFALAGILLAACSTTGSSAPPPDGSYNDTTSGYALTLTAGSFLLTSYNAAGQAVVKSGTEVFGTDGFASFVYDTSPCALDKPGEPESYAYEYDAATGLRLDLPSGRTNFTPGNAPAALTPGCFVDGVFTPSSK